MQKSGVSAVFLLLAVWPSAVMGQAEQIQPGIFRHLAGVALAADTVATRVCLAVQAPDGRVLDPTPTVLEATREDWERNAAWRGLHPNDSREITFALASECGREAQPMGAAFATVPRQEAPAGVDLVILSQLYRPDGSFQARGGTSAPSTSRALCEGTFGTSGMTLQCGPDAALQSPSGPIRQN